MSPADVRFGHGRLEFRQASVQASESFTQACPDAGKFLRMPYVVVRGLTDYYCYALELSDFIPVDAGTDRACRGDNAMDDAEAYKVVSSASSLSECKGQCRSNSACRGSGFGSI